MNALITYLDQHAAAVIIVLLVFIGVELFIKNIQYAGIKKESSSLFQSKQYQFLDELAKNSPDVYILLKMPENIPVYVSENVVQLTGCTPESIYGDIHVLYGMLGRQYRRRLEAALQAWDGMEDFIMEFMYTPHIQEREEWGKLMVRLTEDKQYHLVMLWNISQERAVRASLEDKIKEAQSLDESKTIFLSKMSHEIRTPMNGMLGMISLARISADAGKSSEVLDYLDKAESLSQFLLSIINDILDMTRIESGKLELEKTEFNLFEMIDKIHAMFQSAIEDKGIVFEIERLGFTRQCIIGDELRMTQIVNNFLSNASKFTPKGGKITLTFRQMELQGDRLSIMIRVKDTGKGMSPAFLHRIFKPFEQEDSGIARKYGGSGLGMSISDNLVRLMGGQLLVDSEEGRGSAFTVFLDVTAAQTDTAPEKTEQMASGSLKGRRLLMAEDNEVNIMVASKMLVHRGFIVEVAHNGFEVLEQFQKHVPGYYDAVLMDIHMPGMDGWEATARLRRLERTDAAAIPVLALSADAFAEDRRHSLAVGMNGHIAKPIDYDELEQTLLEQLNVQSREVR